MGGIRSPAGRYVWGLGIAVVSVMLSACGAIPWFDEIEAAHEPGSGPGLNIAAPVTSDEVGLSALIPGTWKQTDGEVYNIYAADGFYFVENREAGGVELEAMRYQVVGDRHIRYEMEDGTSFVLEVELIDPDTLVVYYPATPYSEPRVQQLVRVTQVDAAVGVGLRPDTPENLRILFVDDFSNNENGWPTGATAEAVFGQEGGVYHIRVYADNLLYHVDAPRVEARDVSIEVEATRVGGADTEMSAAVLCRVSSNPIRFYVFEVTFDGYYTIAKYVDGQPVSLGIGYEASRAIRIGNATNHIRADCIGDTLKLYVNGTQLATLQDSELESGRVALGAATFQGKPSAEVTFDNFVVSGR